MFGLSRIELILLGCFALVIAGGGAVAWIYSKGETAGKNVDAAATLKETEDARKLRETNDTSARSLDDARAAICLRNPNGCQR